MLVTAKYYAILAAFMLAVVNAQDTSSSVEVTTAGTATAGTDTATDTGSAAAPSSSSTAGISPCILSCVQPAATKNGCVFSDVTCVCASAQFQADALECLQATCTAADIQAANALQQQECAAAGITPTGSATSGGFTPSGSASVSAKTSGSVIPTTHASATTPATSKAPAATATTTTPNAAANKVVFGYGGLVALGVGAVGLVAGAGLML